MKTLCTHLLLGIVLLCFAGAALAQQPPDFVLGFGLGTPCGIACDSQDNMYVSTYNGNYVYKFTTKGGFVRAWGSQGNGDGQFNCAVEVGCDPSDNVYVADLGNHRIQKFTANGTFLLKWGSLGTGDGQLTNPSGIACDRSGNVYVADSGNHRIQKFVADGTFVLKWGSQGTGDGQFTSPYGIACDPSGNVYVAESGNRRIQKFTADGTFLLKWGAPGSAAGQFQGPRGVVCDRDNNVYVVDCYLNRIQKFTADGTLLLTWGSSGSGGGSFSNPQDIAGDSRGNVYVTDYGNNAVQKFAPFEPHYLAASDVHNDQGRQVRISFVKAARDRSNSPTPVIQYEAYRRIDHLPNAAAQTGTPVTIKGQRLHASMVMTGWEFVGAIPAHGEDDYSMIVSTLADSTGENGVCWSTFFIRATTATPTTFWDSVTGAGYSVDNLAPAAPLNFNIGIDGYLHWDPSPEKDFRYYTVYASYHTTYDATAVMVHHTTATALDVRGTLYPYYYLTASDFAGNESAVVTTLLRPVATAVMASTAVRHGGAVTIRWTVSDAAGDLAFRLYRGAGEDRQLVTSDQFTGRQQYAVEDLAAPATATQYWLEALSAGETVGWYGPIVTSAMPPLTLSLSVAPNPFNPGTTIHYTVPAAGPVTLTVYDVQGRLVETLIKGESGEARAYEFAYQPQIASGVYFLRLTAGKGVTTKRIVFLK